MDIQTISIVIAAIGVFIAAINSIYASRRADEQRQLTLETQQHALETRQAQLFMQIYNRWTAKDMAAAYGLVRYKYSWQSVEESFEKYLPDKDIDAYSNLQILHNFFEGLGLLVKRGLIDITMVEDLFSQRILWHWERHKPVYLQARTMLNDPTQYDSIEYLYNLMKQRQQ
jgi:hypothetical protein